MAIELSPDSNSFSYPFEELLSTSSIIFYHCELKELFPILFISRNVKDILGFEAGAFRRDDTLWIERIHPDDRDLVLNTFRRVVNDKSFATEYASNIKGGTTSGFMMR